MLFYSVRMESITVLTSFSFFTASSHTCIPLDSSTSTRPRYCGNREKYREKSERERERDEFFLPQPH